MEPGDLESGPELELDLQLAREQVASSLFGSVSKPVRLGKFEIIRRLGRGAMGTVYEARDPDRDRRIALKVLSRVDGRGVHQLKQEFRSLAMTSHPNLVVLDELFSDRGLWFFSMELIAGGVTFDAWVRPDARGIDEQRLRSALAQLVAAVSALHAAGKVHCDLKPSNVLVTPSGRVVVLDFGLVTEQERGDPAQSSHSGLVGTPAYLAPEQVEGARPGGASDWYAVGVMLFEALTGRLPFDGNALQMLRAKQKTAAPSARTLLDDSSTVADLAELCDALLARDPAPRLRAAALAAGRHHQPTGSGAPSGSAEAGALHTAPLFVGRGDELQAIRAACSQARDGAVTLLLGGRPGVGKSALLDRFVAELDCDTLVLRGRCREQESMPYKVFDSMIDALAGHLRQMPNAEVQQLVPRHVESLTLLFPELARVQAMTTAVASVAARSRESRDLREQRNEAFAALKEVLLRLTDRSPVVIVIDDLQWGDVDSARMLSHVLGSPEPPPLLLLGAFRSEDAGQSGFLSEWLKGAPQNSNHAQVLEIGPLPPADATELAQQLLRSEGIAVETEFASGLAAEADQLPFFIGELVRHHKALADCSDGQRLPAQPITLERAIMERVGALAQPAQALLQVLCVAGGPLDVSSALRAAELAPDDRTALHSLRAARLLRGQSGRAGNALETYHDRIRETVTRHLAPDALRKFHARIAEVMQRSGNADAEALVMHYVGAGNRARAAECAEQAAAEASRKLAFNRAAELFRMAIELSSAQPEGLCALYCSLAEALVNAGHGAQAADAYLRAAALDPSEDRRLQLLAARQYLRSGRTEQGLAIAHVQFARVGLALPEVGLRSIGAFLWQRARLGTHRLRVPESTARVTPRRLERLNCLDAVFRELSVTDPIRGAALQSQYLREALDSGDRQHTLQGLIWETFNLSLLSGAANQRRARAALAISRRMALEADTPIARALVNLGEGAYHLFGGRSFRSALLPSALAERGFAELGNAGAWERGLAAFVHGVALEMTGPLSAISARGVQILREAQERDDRFVTMLMLLSVPYAYALGGQARDALSLLLDQEHRLDPGYMVSRHLWLLRMMESLIFLDRWSDALSLAREHWDGFRRSSHHRAPLGRDATYFYRLRCTLIGYHETHDLALRRLAEVDIRRLERSPTVHRLVADVARAALAWEDGEHARTVAMLEPLPARFRADDAELLGSYVELALASLVGDSEKRSAVAERLKAQGVHDPALCAWYTLPVGPRP